ncbi:MAG: hypothetical protein A2015_17485 [Spirochaetes bacterium GWF1_31_7]|nr:MAG: hypothetical protein A2Y30_05475 [Spirochaetes bacterium GWE1_32_154]OHD46246.1 MAG: hypothetical protein A2Y29_08480 [Spirochaetes bacterium GWE2_31_10]OHD48616.1 MAG: hypothetical protein A2015_17485 [Spirochaetes bacterium GWF1_31_7]HBD93062.1 hypothetical protein [Spirochaetia bacterium]HBI39199.1 hypothetical protein [Spirochaetia bacterium]
MQKIFFLLLFLLSFKSFSLEYQNIDFSLSDKSNLLKTENPFRNIDKDWLKEDLRIEKIIIASGVIVLAAGFPLFLAGILNIVKPNVDTPETSLTTYYVLTGVGGGLMAAGTGVTIGGGVAFGIKQKKLRIEIKTL